MSEHTSNGNGKHTGAVGAELIASAAAASAATVAELPAQVVTQDLLVWERSQMLLELARSRLRVAELELEKATEVAARVSADLARVYALGPTDSFNRQTGEIQRASRPTA